MNSKRFMKWAAYQKWNMNKSIDSLENSDNKKKKEEKKIFHP